MKNLKLNTQRGGLLTIASACIITAGMLTGCHQKDDVTTKSVVVDIDTIVKACPVTSNYTVEYPTEGIQPLIDSIRVWINSQLGGTYTGNLSDAESIVNHYAQNICRQADEDFDGDEGDELGISYSDETHITREYETDNIVTFSLSNYIYTGGAHGQGVYVGNTFRKDNGASLTWNIFREDATEELQQLIIGQLLQFFEVKTTEELNERLLDTDVENIPLPTTPPAFTEHGIQFTYQSYEIAPYSEGRPQGVIAYKDAMPYLTQEASALLAH
ncbi:MAG: DUF3298 and DUF4163 domain-containing protein [Paraprevotella sp.]|nr:DUF3298 and DUF4163 domain-containing protein [Paraprevotella sp.]